MRRLPATYLAVPLLAVTALGSGCAGGDETTTASTLPSTLAIDGLPAVSADVSTTAPVTATTAPATVASTLAAQPAPATTPAPTAAPTTAAPPTTEPLAIQELILTGDALGSAVFGAEPEGVIEYVSSILGASTADTGWVAPDTFAQCEGTEARKVDWGTLSLLFSDLSKIARGRRHLIGFEYGRVGSIGDEPVGLRTPGGVTLGSRVVDVRAEFPEAKIVAGDETVNIPNSFYLSDVFYGLLTGISDDDYVTVLFGGYGCFE